MNLNAKSPDYSKISVPISILAVDEDKSAPLAGCTKLFGGIGTSEKRLPWKASATGTVSKRLMKSST